MRVNKSNLIIVLGILLGMCIGCDGFSRVSGHVYDTSEKPISEASVVFEAVTKGEPESSYQESHQTDQSGRFSLGFVHAPFDIDLRLSARKDGYKPFTMTMKASEAHKMMEENLEIKIVLEKE